MSARRGGGLGPAWAPCNAQLHPRGSPTRAAHAACTCSGRPRKLLSFATHPDRSTGMFDAGCAAARCCAAGAMARRGCVCRAALPGRDHQEYHQEDHAAATADCHERQRPFGSWPRCVRVRGRRSVNWAHPMHSCRMGVLSMEGRHAGSSRCLVLHVDMPRRPCCSCPAMLSRHAGGFDAESADHIKRSEWVGPTTHICSHACAHRRTRMRARMRMRGGKAQLAVRPCAWARGFAAALHLHGRVAMWAAKVPKAFPHEIDAGGRGGP